MSDHINIHPNWAQYNKQTANASAATFGGNDNDEDNVKESIAMSDMFESTDSSDSTVNGKQFIFHG